MRRRGLLIGGIGLAVTAGVIAAGAQVLGPESAPLGFEPDPDFLAQARALLARRPAIDTHAHPGRSFVCDAEGLSPALALYAARGSFEHRAVADMREGLVCGASFSLVADFNVLDLSDGGLAARRAFAPGEARASYARQLGNLRAALAREGVRIVSAPEDFAAAKAQSALAGFITVEGGDFLDGDLSRVGAAFADGVRSITLMHYRPNEIGDIQTAPAVNDGLTPFGADVIREMEALGMLVDLAHAAEPAARQALEVCTKPVMCSHTHLESAALSHPRFISLELAREIAARGGVIGAWPVGIGAQTLSDYIDRVFALAEALGPEHVAMGTDMDANYKPVFTSYAQTPLVVSELLRRGYGEENAAQFIGGNFLRVFEAVWAGRRA